MNDLTRWLRAGVCGIWIGAVACGPSLPEADGGPGGGGAGGGAAQSNDAGTEPNAAGDDAGYGGTVTGSHAFEPNLSFAHWVENFADGGRTLIIDVARFAEPIPTMPCAGFDQGVPRPPDDLDLCFADDGSAGDYALPLVDGTASGDAVLFLADGGTYSGEGGSVSLQRTATAITGQFTIGLGDLTTPGQSGGTVTGTFRALICP
jgi:hypothetical protein